ncbi:tRNA lysidine(34) synthetase TilS [Xanthobacter sp. TB0139]|uniref:tRNA lysidine(34) synthetase TilS n=1 Tax=Xanthobacter sp. TB0139 TaxID=3459178 RepID=UPI004039B0C3
MNRQSAEPDGSAEDAAPLGVQERDALLAPLVAYKKVLIGISGGPDSTALAWLAMGWRQAVGGGAGASLCAATVDHGLRADSRAEAEEVSRFCAGLGLPHHVLTWRGEKPVRGIQAAARTARYGLLLDLARQIGADALAVAHTADDQAETVLFRLSRGSGLAGLGAMRPKAERQGVALLRPLLSVPKARLVATLQAGQIGFVQDPANSNPRFTRARLRALAPALAEEGLDARRLGQFARRMARADAALEAAVDVAEAHLSQPVTRERSGAERAGFRLPAVAFAALPDEIGLRLLGRIIDRAGHEGPVELGKLESLVAALHARLRLRGQADEKTGADHHPASFRRTLAGAFLEIKGEDMWIFPAPARRNGTMPPDSARILGDVLGNAGVDT